MSNYEDEMLRTSSELYSGLGIVVRGGRRQRVNPSTQRWSVDTLSAPRSVQPKVRPSRQRKTALDWQIRHTRDTPGPGHYRVPDPDKGNLIGHFSDHHNPSALERLTRMKAQLPGPQDYSVQSRHMERGVSFPRGRGLSPLDEAMKNAMMVPGPGEYRQSMRASVTGGRFSKGAVGYYGEASRAQIVHEVTPGPTEYQDGRSTMGTVSGGRINDAEPMSTLDQVEWRASQTPGPGEYDPLPADPRTMPTMGGRLYPTRWE